MKVFHGSNVRIENIDLLKGREFLDFGRGFYVTNIRKHAHRRTIHIALENTSIPIVTEFEYLEDYPANVGLNVKHFYKVSKEWIDFVMINRDRNIPHPTHSFDIVEGPVANDWVTFQLHRYQRKKISIETLLRKLKYREKTHQICFCTIESLWALKQIDKDDTRFDKEDISSLIIHALQNDFHKNIREARQMYFNSDVFFQLSNTETNLCKQPWREIYEILKNELKIITTD